MQDVDAWKPSKFEIRNGKLRASKDFKQVGPGSRLVADLVASFYNSNIPQHVSGRLLDLGCGKVPLYEHYKEHVTENICVDWVNSIHQNTHLDQIADLNKPLPFSDNTFNSIILSDVLEHIREPQLLWVEMSRVLVPGGKLLMNSPFYYNLHEEPYDYFRYTQHALRDMAERNGFKILMLRPIGGIPEILADIHSKFFKKTPIIGTTLAIFIQKLTSLFIKTKLGRKLSQRTAKKFPLGYVMVTQKK